MSPRPHACQSTAWTSTSASISSSNALPCVSGAVGPRCPGRCCGPARRRCAPSRRTADPNTSGSSHASDRTSDAHRLVLDRVEDPNSRSTSCAVDELAWRGRLAQHPSRPAAVDREHLARPAADHRRDRDRRRGPRAARRGTPSERVVARSIARSHARPRPTMRGHLGERRDHVVGGDVAARRLGVGGAARRSTCRRRAGPAMSCCRLSPDEQRLPWRAPRLGEGDPVDLRVGLAGAGLLRARDRVEPIGEPEAFDHRLQLLVVDVGDHLDVDRLRAQLVDRRRRVGPERRRARSWPGTGGRRPRRPCVSSMIAAQRYCGRAERACRTARDGSSTTPLASAAHRRRPCPGGRRRAGRRRPPRRPPPRRRTAAARRWTSRRARSLNSVPAKSKSTAR